MRLAVCRCFLGAFRSSLSDGGGVYGDRQAAALRLGDEADGGRCGGGVERAVPDARTRRNVGRSSGARSTAVGSRLQHEERSDGHIH